MTTIAITGATGHLGRLAIAALKTRAPDATLSRWPEILRPPPIWEPKCAPPTMRSPPPWQPR